MNKIFALTTRGLEAISANELAAVAGVTVDHIAYRRVFASCQGPLAPLIHLRTVDDVFLHAATWPDIGRSREALNTLKSDSARLSLSNFAVVCAQVRSIQRPAVFSVTANFVGKRNYTTAEIKQACAAGIVEGQGWVYSEDDGAADLNVRLFIEGNTAVVGVRLAAQPLSRRPYKQHHVPGSLKPAVAAAALALVGAAPGLRVLDPCCGAGTILIEAKRYGAEALGGDADSQAAAAARVNALNAGAGVHIQQWDARALPIADGSADRVVSNLPWGRVVSGRGSLNTLYQEIGREIERVLAPEGQAALLTSRPDLVRFQRLKCERQIEISLFGQTPTIMVWSAPSTASSDPTPSLSPPPTSDTARH